VPEELGSRAAVEPLPVGLVALTRYQQGSKWRPRPLSPGKAVLELLQNTVPAQRDPERVLSTLECLVPRSRNIGGRRGEALDTVPALLAELSA